LKSKLKSMNIIIGSFPERSSINSALIVAEFLKEHGHSVTIVSSADNEFKAHIEKQGFAYTAIGPGNIRELLEIRKRSRNVITVWKVAKELELELQSSLNEFADENVGRFDLAFMSLNATYPASVILSHMRVPTIVFKSNYGSRFSLRYPPVTLSRPVVKDGEASSWWRAFVHLAAWSFQLVHRQVVEPGFLSPKRLPAALVKRLLSPIPRQRRQSERNGWKFCWGEWGLQPKLPEIVVGHRALDWEPLRQSSDRLYLASLTQRREFETEWSQRLETDRPLLFLNMSSVIRGGVLVQGGTVVKWARVYKRYLDVVIAAVGTKPDWQLLAACGPFAEAFDTRNLPVNVQVFDRLPQIEVLEKAALAITPAGPGTVRECASLGVPMLAFPMWYDQYGNAARIQHAGMGLNGGDFRKLDESRVVRLIDRVLHDDIIKSTVLAFRQNQVVDRETEWKEFRAFVEEHTGLCL
jgi:hypothetical protein